MFIISQTLFLIVCYCFCLFGESANVFERKVWCVQVAHLHSAASALLSPSRCRQLSTNLEKDFLRYLLCWEAATIFPNAKGCKHHVSLQHDEVLLYENKIKWSFDNSTNKIEIEVDWGSAILTLLIISAVFTFIIWLAPRASKINQILRCDWLPERARWSYLARSGLPAVSRKKNFPKSHIINPLLTKFVRSRWLDIGLVPFFACLWTSTASRSINTQKMNLANIPQPSWTHTWSITHTS